MNKKYYNWKDVTSAATSIAMQMYKDNYRPDYIVGITRGGLPLATILSHMTNIPMETLKVQLRASEQCETNCWMSEDAFGYVSDQATYKSRWDVSQRKKILIVDDINDTGATFDWIKEDWRSGCLPGEDTWDTVWHNTVKFAVMTDNLSSSFKTDYAWDEVNKAENDVWLVYPWEA